MRMDAKPVLLAVVASAILSSCAAEPGGAQVELAQPTVVTVEIYSGRENPTFTVDSESAGAIETSLSRAMDGERVRESPRDALGFNGFVFEAFVDGDPVEVVVAADEVTISDGTGTAIHTQQSDAFAVLLRSASTQLESGTVRAIKEGQRDN